MAILTTVKDKMTTGLMTAADKGANLVSKASGLSSNQLDNIEARRRRFMSEKAGNKSGRNKTFIRIVCN